jgi:urease accessory protein
MTRWSFFALLACLVVMTTPAYAHAPIMGIEGVLGGFLHALLIPEHGMSLVALGLALGREDQNKRRYGLLVFTAALTAGLLAVGLGAESTFAGDVLLAATGVLGLLVAVAWVPALLYWPLIVVVGVAFALDSKPDVTATDELVRMLVGSGLGGALALTIVAEVSFLLRGAAQRIVARVLGSWIAAIAILDLALRIATRIATG